MEIIKKIKGKILKTNTKTAAESNLSFNFRANININPCRIISEKSQIKDPNINPNNELISIPQIKETPD